MCSEQFYQAIQELEPDETTTTSLPSLDPNQAVREVPQKGQGLHSLRRSLSIFSEAVIESEKCPDGTDKSPNKDTHARQLQLEEDSINAAIERWKIEHEKLARLRVGSSLRGQTLGSLMWDWHKSLKPLIEEELKRLDKAEVKKVQTEEDRDRCAYGPFLRVLSVDKLSAITILTAINSLSFEGFEKGARLGQLVAAVGHTVEEESNADDVNVRAKMHGPDPSTAWKRSKRLRTLQRVKSKMSTPLSAEAFEKAAATRDNVKPESVRWTLSQKIKVGSVLVSALTKAAKLSVQRIHPTTQEVVNQVQPAFNHVYLIKRGRKLGMLFMNTLLIEKVKKEPVPHVIAKYLPMVVEPAKWTGFSRGGYIRYPTRVVRIKDADICQLQYAKTAAKRGDLDQVFAGLDVLGKVPWIINRKVFDVMLEAWNTGEALADIPPADPKINFPPEPAPSATRDERYNWTRRVRELENEKSGLHSQRCFQNFQLEVAKAFRDEKFYFPHNMDFRGRAYPIPPYLNHMGADNARGLLLFAEAKELGAAGLVWLKIHLANVFGYDKASFKEREDFTMEHMADIFDSASRPLGGSRWWLKAEDPWQCLATCIELKSALESPNPSRFRSRLPIHQDGTCNGLQHYAALGGDAWGAKQVNLEPGERPADVYTAVAEEIKRDISEDARSGLAVAKLLDGFITRKVVKQTVMTNVYGVTFVGASAQVRRQLTEALPNTVALDMPYSKLSRYVAKKIFKALSAMFGGAHEIQFWLAECAKRISEAVTPAQIEQLIARSSSDGVATEPVKRKRPFFRTPVIWTTPLKMPVVQPYRKFEAKSVATTMQQITIFEPSPTDPVSKRKQLQAFPPNFVHSLDATHMLLSALKCNEAGLTFASVHDSFWTHAGSIDSMNCILRDSFIRIHSEDVIGRLAAEFRARYKDCLYYTAIPSAGPAGRKVKEWRRGQSTEIRRNSKPGNIQMRELFLERERLNLLSSANPEDVERGRRMVTPASILEDHGGEPFGFFERAECVKAGSSPADGSSPLEDMPTAEDYSAPDLDVHDTSDMREDDKPKRAASALHIWLPLRFPDVPKKVKRLQDYVQKVKANIYFVRETLTCRD